MDSRLDLISSFDRWHEVNRRESVEESLCGEARSSRDVIICTPTDGTVSTADDLVLEGTGPSQATIELRDWTRPVALATAGMDGRWRIRLVGLAIGTHLFVAGITGTRNRTSTSVSYTVTAETHSASRPAWRAILAHFFQRADPPLDAQSPDWTWERQAVESVDDGEEVAPELMSPSWMPRIPGPRPSGTPEAGVRRAWVRRLALGENRVSLSISEDNQEHLCLDWSNGSLDVAPAQLASLCEVVRALYREALATSGWDLTLRRQVAGLSVTFRRVGPWLVCEICADVTENLSCLRFGAHEVAALLEALSAARLVLEESKS